MATVISVADMHLEPTAGPPMPAAVIPPDKLATIGRSAQCQVVLPDESVSRRHVSIMQNSGSWFVTDLSSTHGTMVNGVRLRPNAPMPLGDGDFLTISPWTFRVALGSRGPTGGMRTMDDTTLSGARVQKVGEKELAQIASTRLNLIIDCAAAITSAANLDELAKCVLEAATHGTGFPNGALIREVTGQRPGQPGGEQVEVLGAIGQTKTEGENASFSRSLIAAARNGEIARLTGDRPLDIAQSIVKLGITSAMCAPIMLGGSVAAYLYLDARGGAGRVQIDAAAFCQAIAKLCGLALGNIKRAELEGRQAQLVSDLQAAQAAQRLIMPPDEGSHSQFRYAVRMRSGRYVAGDLFDVVPLADGRVAMFLGDVAGKGIGAAILMATAQTLLNMTLRTTGDPLRAVADTNRYLAGHSSQDKFVSLWLGVFDPVRSVVSVVDAGHGYFLVRSGAGRASTQRVDGGIPLGIDEDFLYQISDVPFVPGDRLVVFSDGIVEQPNADGEQFGMQRTIGALDETSDPMSDVARLFGAVDEFAQSDSLADDATIASLERIFE